MMAVTCWVSPATESGLHARCGMTVNEGRHAPAGMPFFIARVERPVPEVPVRKRCLFFKRRHPKTFGLFFKDLILGGF
ncbi:hypothetical protein [Komagataeibacter swingsii]|uniref:Uncharacterized protein n=1 Tax=Komagataeibacter swingsii TaxID=215220 RepID=A0A850P0A9_9PROT|nr:hypothetical protein [Komagataeibacter swingsii]NVN36239.1 hypothetical protein [Komagataeibacter swingsii]